MTAPLVPARNPQLPGEQMILLFVNRTPATSIATYGSIRVTSAVLEHQAIHDDAVRACGEQLNDTGSGRGKDPGSRRGPREHHIWRGDRDVHRDAEEGGEPDDLARVGGGEGRGEARLVRDDNVGGDGTGSSTADGE